MTVRTALIAALALRSALIPSGAANQAIETRADSLLFEATVQGRR